jgi:hypothetical protein
MTTKERYTLGDSPMVDIDGCTYLGMTALGFSTEHHWTGLYRTRQSELTKFNKWREAITHYCGNSIVAGEFINPAQRSERKSRPDLLPSEAVLAAGRVLAFGLEKHPDELWKTLSVEDHVAACTRHLFTYLGGEKQDNESSESHLAHALCRLAFAIARSAE